MISLNDFTSVFFIGVAGTGMSALAQYLSGIGKKVSGSDRYFLAGEKNEIRNKLEAEGITCFLQNGEGITAETELVVVSTAVEDTVPEVQKALSLSIPVIKRSELLALIAANKRSVAIGGTSGKSTTSAMLFQIMETAGMNPSIISGAGLISIIKEGKIGNAKVGLDGKDGNGWLIIEADESDGSIVQYKPEVGLLLNIDKDHQEIEELVSIFTVFKNNTRDLFVVNRCNAFTKELSQDPSHDFSIDKDSGAGYIAENFKQEGMSIAFSILDPKHGKERIHFQINTIGRHNMENALGAVAVANQLGVPLEICSAALSDYEGIYRRHQLLGKKNGVYVIDDYAHNPAKCAASIVACQQVGSKVIAWFQPHGYGPTRFLKNDFVKEIAAVLRPQDEIWMSEIFYAGGTAIKNISANELISDIRALGKNAYFIENRDEFLEAVRSHLNNDSVLLLMGARDPGLEEFSKKLYQSL